MRRFPRIAIFLAAILVFGSCVFGQRPTQPGGVRFGISGYVKAESDSKPIQGAQAQLTTDAGQIISATYSGPKGEFTFPNLMAGGYIITFKAEGFEQLQQTIIIRTMNPPELNVALHKSAVTKDQEPVMESAVSARELGLSQKTQDAFSKGKELLYDRHDPAGSLKYFHKVLEQAPAFYEAHYHEGVAYTFEEKPAEAESAFQKAITESQGRYADPCFALASLLTDQKRFAEAEKLSRQGLESQPDAWRGHYELARALLGLGRPDDAEKSGIEARKRKSDFPGLYLILANIHLQLHKNESLLDDVNAYLKLEPDGSFSTQAREIKKQVERALGRQPS